MTDKEALVTYLKWVRSAGEYSQLPLAVRRVYARCSGARRYRLSRRRLCVGRTRRAVVLAKPAYASQGQIDKWDANAYLKVESHLRSAPVAASTL